MVGKIFLYVIPNTAFRLNYYVPAGTQVPSGYLRPEIKPVPTYNRLSTFRRETSESPRPSSYLNYKKTEFFLCLTSNNLSIVIF